MAMGNKTPFYLFIGVVLGISLYLTYIIFNPFITPILLGIIFSVAFQPVYLKALGYTNGRKAMASISVCLLISFVIVIPIVFLIFALTGEITTTYNRLDEVITSGKYKDLFPFIEYPFVQNLYRKVNNLLAPFKTDINNIILGSVRDASSYGISAVTGVIKNLGLFIINLFLMLFTTYYLLKDSEKISSGIIDFMPLPGHQKDRILNKLKDIIYATLYGSIAAAVAQGFLGGLAFWVLGIESPLLWGTVMGLLAIIPMLGAFIVWLPASIILLIQGSYIKAVILFLLGSLVISMVDNLIRPLLMSGRAMLHPLVTFFGVLGGLFLFGITGLFIGPFAAALSLILLDMLTDAATPEIVSPEDKQTKIKLIERIEENKDI